MISPSFEIASMFIRAEMWYNDPPWKKELP